MHSLFKKTNLIWFFLLPHLAVSAFETNLEPEVSCGPSAKKFMQQYGDVEIASIEINGLERTDIRIVHQFLTASAGDKLSEFNEGHLKEDLARQLIFSMIDVCVLPYNPESSEDETADPGQYKVEQAKIIINLEEKWSLYPVPVLVYYEDTSMAGVYLVESNAWGKNIGWVMGGVMSNRGWQYLLGVVDPNVNYTDTYLQMQMSGGDVFVENATPDGEVYQQYAVNRHDFLFSVGYTFSRHFTPIITGGYRTVRVPADRNKNYTNVPESADLAAGGLKMIYSTLQNKFYYLQGFRSSLEYKKGFGLGQYGVETYNWISQIAWHDEGFADHSYMAAVYMAYSDYPEVFHHRLGGLEATRTLPAFLVPADNYVSSTFVYQIPVYQSSWGTVTTVQFLEYGFYNTDDNDLIYYWGPGAGFRFYLKDITIPAFGVDIAYEVNTRAYNISLAIGYRPTR